MTPRAFSLLLLLTLLWPWQALAESPSRIPVHGTLNSSDGAPITGDLDVVFTLHTDAAGTSQAWSETQSVTFDAGVFTALLGANTPLDQALFRDYDELYLSVAVNGDSQMAPIPLATAPFSAYATYCGEASTVGGMSVDALYTDFAQRIGSTGGGYTDADAVAAMGTLEESNPLNHPRFGPSEAVAAMGGVADANTLNHVRAAPQVIHTRDGRAGCPGAAAVDTDLIAHTFDLTKPTYVSLRGDIIRSMAGRADLYLLVDGTIQDRTLTYTSTVQWEDAHVVWGGLLDTGTHTVSLRSNVADAWGCGADWGSITTTIFE